MSIRDTTVQAYEAMSPSQRENFRWDAARRLVDLDAAIRLEVSLLPDEDWAKGPSRVAEQLATAQARLLAERTPQVEHIAFDEESEVFHIETPIGGNPELLQATLSRSKDALADCLNDTHNAMNEQMWETRVLQRSFEEYGDDPQRLDLDFSMVSKSIQKSIDTQELPDSEEISALLEALNQSRLAITDSFPEIARNRRIIEHQTFDKTTTVDRLIIEDALLEIVQVADDNFARKISDDIDELVGASALTTPIEHNAGGSTTIRVANRVAHMWLLAKEVSARTFNNVPGRLKYKKLANVSAKLLLLVSLFSRILGL